MNYIVYGFHANGQPFVADDVPLDTPLPGQEITLGGLRYQVVAVRDDTLEVYAGIEH